VGRKSVVGNPSSPFSLRSLPTPRSVRCLRIYSEVFYPPSPFSFLVDPNEYVIPYDRDTRWSPCAQ